ncbi:hypothetical protein [Paenibacillus rubinfantis]|uniref:hypothetical protein n=1 Tax=Paenibacillus rubinfantis TaxID=1720296 RepID=UPI00073E62FB|nr:hypothetical protein [Paenibacillus rubinfantis]
MKFLKKDIVLRALLLSVVLMSIATPVFAADGPGKKLGDWLSENVGGVIPGILALIGGYHLIKRDWMKLMSFVGIALVVAILLNWNDVKKLGEYLFDQVFGGSI